MDQNKHHEQLIKGISEQLKSILKGSKQAVYIYMDNSHNVCNGKFARLLGYNSSAELGKVGKSFLDAFVAPKSQKNIVNAYRDAMEKKIGSTIKVTWKKKTGGTVDTTVILVPIAYDGHLFALHFVS